MSAGAGEGASVLDRVPVRFVVVVLLIVGLIAVGLALEAGKSNTRGNLYLLLTLPATVLFQILVNRRPVQGVWVRAAPPFRLDRVGVLLALLIAIAPAVLLVRDLREGEPVLVLYDLVAIGGAVAAAYAIRAATRATLRQLLLCLATAGAIGVALNVLQEVHTDLNDGYFQPLTRRDLDIGLGWFLIYLPVLFMLEEVFFRGALDSYLHRPGEGTGWLSALVLSMLWGWWHIPFFYPEMSLPRAFVAVLPMQVLVGIPLSLWWRRSGNLIVPGVSHALIDSVRNALSGLP